MSNVVDERVVEMRFDNKQFESNVKTTMGTLDKLKQALKFKGIGSSLKDLSNQSGFIGKNMNVLAKGVQDVSVQFNALQTIGSTCLVNLTEAAIRTGKKIVSALTIEPVTTGFQEYETKIGAIQTILANTSSKGEDIHSVTRVIDELNTYADKTIYNFAEMTRNIGTFTAAGVGLEESAAAIQGIANVAAVSGSTSQQASTAMYQLSQALAAGTVKLMDWNSVVNAGMGGEKLQEALKATAREFGIDVDSMIDKAGSFRESLSQGWITADVLNTTLRKFTVEGAKDYADMMLASGQYTAEQANALMKEAQMAEDAATKVKTLTQLWDTLKETAQSGWGKTWELIIGDFEEAKVFFTDLNDMFSPMIDAMSDARNNLIEDAMTSKWGMFQDIIADAGVSAEAFEKQLKLSAASSGVSINQLIKDFGSLDNAVANGAIPAEVFRNALTKLADKADATGLSASGLTDKLQAFQDAFDGVWEGKFGNGQERIDALTAAGFRYADVQDLVSKHTYGYQLTLDDLTDAQWEEIGVTQDQISVLRQLAEEAGDANTPISQLLDSLERPSGRQLLLGSLMNIIQSIVNVFGALRNAWFEVFSPASADGLYDILYAINQFTERIRAGSEQLTGLKNIVKIVITVFKMLGNVIGGSFRFAFNAVSTLLSSLNIDIGGSINSVSEAISSFEKWTEGVLDFDAAFEKIKPSIENMGKAFLAWIENIRSSETAPADIITAVAGAIMNAFDFVAGSAGSVIEYVRNQISDMTSGLDLIGGIRDQAEGIISNITSGLENGAGTILDVVQNIGASIMNRIANFDWGTAFAGILMGGSLYTVNRFIDSLQSFTGFLDSASELMESASGMFESIGGFVKGLGDSLKSMGFESKARGILMIAGAIAVLAGAVYVLGSMESGALAQGSAVVIGLASVLILFSIALTKIDPAQLEMLSTSVLKIAGAIAILAFCVKLLSGIDTQGLENAAWALVAIIGAIMIVMLEMVAIDAIAKSVGSFSDISTTMIKIGIAMGIMVLVVKLASSISEGELRHSMKVISFIGVLFGGMIAVSMLAGRNAAQAGAMLMEMAIAFGIMLFVVRSAAKLKKGDVDKAIKTLAKIELLFAEMLLISRLGGSNAAVIGVGILAMSGALILMAVAVKIAASIPIENVKKGLAVISAVSALIAGLIYVSKYSGKHAMQAGVMILAVSGALILISAAIFMLGMMSKERLARATVAIDSILLMFSGLIAASGRMKDVKMGPLIAMTVAIGILVSSVIALAWLDEGKLKLATAAVDSLLLMFSGVIAATGRIGTEGMAKSIAVLTMIGVLVGVIVWAFYMMDELNPENVINSAKSIAAVLGAMSMVVRVSSKVPDDWSGILRSLAMIGGLTLIVLALGGVLALVSKVDVNLKTVAAIGILLAEMGLIAGIAGKVGTSGSWASMGQFLIMMAGLTVVVAGLALILNLIKDLDPTRSIGNVVALGILMGVMSIVGVQMGALGLLGPKILIGTAMFGILAVCVAGLAGILLMLKELDPNKAIANAIALSIIIGALTVAGTLLGAIAAVGPWMVLGAVAFAGLSACLYMIADVLNRMESMDLQNGYRNANLLCILLDAMAKALPYIAASGIVGFVGILAGDTGIAVLTKILPDIGEALELMGHMDIQNGARNAELLCILIDALAKAIVPIGAIGALGMGAIIGATAIGELVGILELALVGFEKFIAPELPQTATHLTDFMTNLQGFIDGAKNIDQSAVDGATNLAAMITAMAGAGVIDALTTGIFGSWDSKLSKSLPEVGRAISEFSSELTSNGDFDSDAVNAASSAGQMIAALVKNMPREGGVFNNLIDAFIGKKDMNNFGKGLAEIGKGMAEFSKSLVGVSVAKVQAGAEAVAALASVTKEIPNTGGLLGDLVGDNLPDAWGKTLGKLGEGITNFSTNISDASLDDVRNGAQCVTALAQACNEIPNTGGLLGDLVGDNLPDDFGSKLGGLGEGLAKFSAWMDDVHSDKVKEGAEAAKAVAIMSQEIQNEGGLVELIVGDNKLDKFADDLAKLGGALKAASDSMDGVDKGTLDLFPHAVTEMKIAMNALPEVDIMDWKMDEADVAKFQSTVPPLMHAMKTAADSAKNISFDTLSKRFDQLKSLVPKINEIAGMDIKSTANFTNSLKQLGTASVSSFTNAFSAGSSSASLSASNLLGKIVNTMKSKAGQFTNVGKTLMSSFSNGFSSNTSGSTSTANTVINRIENALRSGRNKMYEAGNYLVEGFANGISTNANKAVNAAIKLAQKTIEATNNTVEVASPSKVFYRIGEFVVAGFANALDDGGDKAERSGRTMAEKTTRGFSKAISGINAAFSEDNLQPTIRPVLDLSEVQNGARAVNGMFENSALGLLSDSRSINRAITATQSANRGSEVISAIDKLRRDLGSIGGDTYNINGVNYSEGSDVGEAIKTLVRAARIERRV